jgi:hypothetical protein
MPTPPRQERFSLKSGCSGRPRAILPASGAPKAEIEGKVGESVHFVRGGPLYSLAAMVGRRTVRGFGRYFGLDGGSRPRICVMANAGGETARASSRI